MSFSILEVLYDMFPFNFYSVMHVFYERGNYTAHSLSVC